MSALWRKPFANLTALQEKVLLRRNCSQKQTCRWSKPVRLDKTARNLHLARYCGQLKAPSIMKETKAAFSNESIQGARTGAMAESDKSCSSPEDRSEGTEKGGLPVLGPGAVVALGKFDALHVGHRMLAQQASLMGTPWMLSFAGMAEVLGWEERRPLVAACERRRILQSWSAYCNNTTPGEHCLDFSQVRKLSPEDFVLLLANQLKVKGVVAGGNYRFGYKAMGDAQDLLDLCERHKLAVHIVEPVLDGRDGEDSARECVDNGYVSEGSEIGQVSSTRVRKALKAGNMERAALLLGRRHRVVIPLADIHFKQCETMGTNEVEEGCQSFGGLRDCGGYGVETCEVEDSAQVKQVASFARGALLNESPRDGEYVCRVYLHGDGTRENEESIWNEVFVGEGVLKLSQDIGVVQMFESFLDECVTEWAFLAIEC